MDNQNQLVDAAGNGNQINMEQIDWSAYEGDLFEEEKKMIMKEKAEEQEMIKIKLELILKN